MKTKTSHMLHAYFRPNGQVLFAEFDPLVTCQIPSTSMIAQDEGLRGISLLGLGLLAAAVLIAVRRVSARASRLRTPA